MIELESKALTWRFWEILSRFFKLENGFKGTIREFATELDINLSDGFFYNTILPVLVKNKILVNTGEKDRFGYRGRLAEVYRFDRDALSIFFIKNCSLAGRIYKVWIKEGDVPVDIE